VKKETKTQSKLRKFEQTLKGAKTLLIMMQDNPDPDSMAAAVAMKKFANASADIKCTIAHGGTVGRAENRALVNYLNLNLRQCSGVDFTNYNLIATVDTQPGTGNNSIPENVLPDIVVDHHPMKNRTRSAKFYDVRSKYGATATILLEYLCEKNIEIDMPLATALLYAIRSDTQDLGREATDADIKAIEILFPLANKRMLSEIQRGSVPAEYFAMLAEALRNAWVFENSTVTHLGNINNPDMIGEVADLLLREDNTFWTMCTCLFKDKMLISIRTSGQNNRADRVIKRITARKGTGGGHYTYAGGQIPVNNMDDSSRKNLKELVQQRFLKATGTNQCTGKKLI
jgi:nanoRNase/pAp phosphatase (c-di-AMP/oligoRNAs hydrolase)